MLMMRLNNNFFVAKWEMSNHFRTDAHWRWNAHQHDKKLEIMWWLSNSMQAYFFNHREDDDNEELRYFIILKTVFVYVKTNAERAGAKLAVELLVQFQSDKSKFRSFFLPV